MDGPLVKSLRTVGAAFLIAAFAGLGGTDIAHATDHSTAENPCAVNPCAVNPCAVNPCAANPCAVNLCAAGGVASTCVIPRLIAAQANPCNPCAANPCAVNPCNPCAANPCAVNLCNPCAVNPCAAANPCNPCAGANPCAANPCNPCAAAAPVELTDEEAIAAYQCIKPSLKAGYGKSNLMSDTGLAIATNYQDWTRYSTLAYQSATHGGRFVQNYANAVARIYGEYENAGAMPAGAVTAKDSFAVNGGQVVAGPLFVMEKMPAGFNADSGDWRYTLVMPDGKMIGTTNGKGSENVAFCADCHTGTRGDQTDSLFFVPLEYRVEF